MKLNNYIKRHVLMLSSLVNHTRELFSAKTIDG